MRKTIYISGPISKMPNGNFHEFAAVEEKLNAMGHQTINPHTICKDINPNDFLTAKDFWNACMRQCLNIMCQKAQEVVTLDGWEQSEGAQLEVYNARKLDIPVHSTVNFFHLENLKQQSQDA